MALPIYSGYLAGTTTTWKNTGGDETFTLTSLADGAGRQADKSGSLIHADYGLCEFVDFKLTWAAASAADNGRKVELWVGASSSATAATDNPGGLGGTDAALSNASEITQHLEPVDAMPLSNALGTGSQVKRGMIFVPSFEYLIPVIYNDSGKAGSATAGDFELVMTPFYRKIDDYV